MKARISEHEAKIAWDYWYPLVYGYFYRRLNSRSDVEELTANSIAALLLKPDVQNPKAFIWKTARNQLVEFIKKKKKNPHIVSIENLPEIPQDKVEENLFDSAEFSSNFKNKMDQIQECLKNATTTEEYSLVCCSIIENKNSTQISQIFQIKPATVRQKLKRTIKKLREHCTSLWLDANQI
jgi:RNA polymerase sigma factor (sigma-70 family)